MFGAASRLDRHGLPGKVERRFRAMGTDVHLVATGDELDDLDGPLDRAVAVVEDRERRWSRFLPDSEVSRINAAAGRPVIVAADTFDLVAAALDARRLTGGAFDPTLGEALRSAGYDRSFELIDTSIPASGPSAPGGRPSGSGNRRAEPVDVELHPGPRSVMVPEGSSLDLGGIAKGATAEAVVAGLRADGVSGCCVNLGGDLLVDGRSPDPRGWTVTLDCPGSDEERTITLGAGAVCTSTVLKRRWLAQDGGAEHHLRLPRTGAALDTGVVSIVVIAARADQAEVLTKAAMVAGIDGAAAVVAAHGATGLLVDDEGRIVEFDGFDRFDLTERTAPQPGCAPAGGLT